MTFGLRRFTGWVLPLLMAVPAAAVLPTAASLAQDSGPIILAHRGGAHEFDENTMEAFRTVYDRGIRAYETDIRMTKDGVMVVLHDDSLDRTHNATGPVEEKTADEIRDLVTKNGQKMLFLEELLQYLADKPGMYVELEMKTSNKALYPDERIEPYAKTLHALAQKYQPEGSTYLFTSFDERPLRAIRQIDDSASMALIAGKPLTDEFIAKCLELGTDHVACQLSGTTRDAVQKAQKAGIKVNCWPGHTLQDYLLGVGLGVDVSCTDIPMAVIDFHERRLPAAGSAQQAGPIILAHRGGAHEFEENTMEAFQAVYDRGIRAYETDIRMTKDGVMVVLHDDSLDRTHNATGPVEEKTADEIRDLVTKKGQKMLFLEELLQYLADKPGMYVELEMKTSNKSLYPDERIETYAKTLHALAQKYQPEGSTYLFTSFDERPLRAIRQIDDQATMVYIEGKPLTDEFIAKCLELGAIHAGCRLSGTTRTAVQKAQKAGIKVNCWPGHTLQDYLLGVGLGVDVSCTDIPMAVIDFAEKLPALKP